jgi:hypothetical protein
MKSRLNWERPSRRGHVIVEKATDTTPEKGTVSNSLRQRIDTAN